LSTSPGWAQPGPIENPNHSRTHPTTHKKSIKIGAAVLEEFEYLHTERNIFIFR